MSFFDFEWGDEDGTIADALKGLRAELEDKGPALPNYLSDPTKLAKIIYEFWVNTLNSDNIDHNLMYWNELSGEETAHLAESCQVNVIEPLRKYLDELEKSRAKSQAPAPEPAKPIIPSYVPPATYPCYTCGKNKVYQLGQACYSCVPRK